VSDETATISWSVSDESTPVTSRVLYGTSSGSYTITGGDQSGTGAQTYALPGLTEDTTYFFVVEAEDGVGNSATSDEYSFTTEVAPFEIGVGDFYFDPSTSSHSAGTTVEFIWEGGSPHTVNIAMGGDEYSNEGISASEPSHTFTFEDTGTYSLTCDFHPSMTGTITIT
jgi:plastocyanin